MKIQSLPIPAMKSVEGRQPIPLQNMVEQKKAIQQQRQVVAYSLSS